MASPTPYNPPASIPRPVVRPPPPPPPSAAPPSTAQPKPTGISLETCRTF